MFSKNKTTIALSGIEWWVVYFRKLPFETNNREIQS